MRHGVGSWVEVIHVYPTPEYGVTHPQSEEGRWGFQTTMYMENGQVLNLSGPGRTAYFDNIKIGSENATFEMMSNDGSAPGTGAAPPAAPRAEVQ